MLMSSMMTKRFFGFLPLQSLNDLLSACVCGASVKASPAKVAAERVIARGQDDTIWSPAWQAA